MDNVGFTFGEPTNLGPTVNSLALDKGPSISNDGLTLFFYSGSNRPGSYGSTDLWVTTRVTVDDPWSEPVNLGPTVNSWTDEFSPSISVDGMSLYFSSRLPGGADNGEIWVTTRPTVSDPWGEPIFLGPNINSSAWEQDPAISADGLALFFCSTRPPGDWYDEGIWVAARATVSDPWGEPVRLVSPVGIEGREESPVISTDGMVLYFDSNWPGGSGHWDIWQVSIEPVVDLNSDGIVDSEDMCIIVDHWGTDEPLCDIGPMPWGDGIVDVQDLIVLAEHLFEEVPPVE